MSKHNKTITPELPKSYEQLQYVNEQLKRNLAALDKMLNARISRSVDIETVLISMAQGKLPLPSKQDCRVMALRLGTPKAEWSDLVVHHQWQGFQGGVDASKH